MVFWLRRASPLAQARMDSTLREDVATTTREVSRATSESALMMPPIQMGLVNPVHKLKFCTKCQADKPPEGGVDMGAKWNCQLCWVRRITGKHLRQNAKTETT
jgi:hypothetical protein